MRRKDKEIIDIAAIEAILKETAVCRLGLCDEGQPYVVPVCFGYKDNVLYFHSAGEGRKLEILRKNNNVCFEVDIDQKIVKARQGCDWGMNYKSVIGFGRAVFIEDVESKRRALDIIMAHYSDKEFQYPDHTISKTIIVKVEIESMTGKKSG